ncbi:MAG: type II secretion system protein [Ruminococcaceae bacterium]|nr:type II secretion system protein [Oscillospiraceae bacterium]
MKRNNKKGFTLAELLIVVAIIAVLTAIAIPVFTAQLHKSQDATDMANCRSLYANLQADFLTNASSAYTAPTSPLTGAGTGLTGFTFADGQTYTLKSGTVDITLRDDGWYVEYECSQGHGDHWGAPAAGGST